MSKTRFPKLSTCSALAMPTYKAPLTAPTLGPGGSSTGQYSPFSLLKMSQSWDEHRASTGTAGDIQAIPDGSVLTNRPAQRGVSDSESSIMQADIMLWQRRSRGSLRRHEVGKLDFFF